tara:strand:- start:261 stop:1232 length:972 start_codon:yes stop_codon:yes gene_type:complete
MEPNSFTKTSFCGTKIDNITVDETKEYILNQMSIFCSGIKFSSRYAKIYNDQYSKNLNNPHLFFLKSSGTPYLLFLTQINNTNYCFLIDKKTNNKYSFPKILIVPYNFSNYLYSGTLFECELIKDKYNNWSLGINDIYYNSGKNMKKTVIIDRINSINDIFENDFSETEYSKICPLFVKKYFDYNKVHEVKNKFIPSLPYNIRGVYFVPMRVDYSNILYLFPKDDKLNNLPQQKQDIKIDKNTKIFRIMKTMKPDVYELYLNDGDNLVKKGIALVQNTELSHKLLSYFENKTQMDEVKVECKLDTNFNKWKPICLSDKEISQV